METEERLTDDELAERLTALRLDVSDISQQLEDDTENGFARGMDWRHRAGTARRAMKREIHELEAVAREAGLTRAFPAQHEKAEEKARRRAERAQRNREEVEAAEAKKRQRAEAHERFLVLQAEISRERAERKRSISAANIEASKRQTEAQASLFVKAARLVLTGEDFRRIWDKAKADDPTNPVWTMPEEHNR